MNQDNGTAPDEMMFQHTSLPLCSVMAVIAFATACAVKGTRYVIELGKALCVGGGVYVSGAV